MGHRKTSEFPDIYPYHGDYMSYSDDTDPKQTPIPDPAENAGPNGWLDALNSFLERAYLKADRDTGC